jgi:hypothetical protein
MDGFLKKDEHSIFGEACLWVKGCAETRHENFEIWDSAVESCGTFGLSPSLLSARTPTQTRLPGRKPRLLTLPRPPVSPHAAVVLFLLIASCFPLLHKA